MGRSGSGLGLAVVHGIVQDHQGLYEVKSTLGEGTEFSFFFPLVQPELGSDLHKTRDLKGQESVLVIDDDAEQRGLATRLLASLGYRVSTVSGGREAMKFLTEHETDILVVDMILGNGPDGLDTYREILETAPTQKAVIVTGFSSTDRVNEMQRLGAGACVGKPYTREQLATAIRDELDRAERPSPRSARVDAAIPG